MHPALLAARGGIGKDQSFRRAIAIPRSERQVGPMLEPAAANRNHGDASSGATYLDLDLGKRGRP